MKKGLYLFLFCLFAGTMATSCLKDKIEKEEFYYTDSEYETLQQSGLDLPKNRPHEYDFNMPGYLLANRFGFAGVNQMDDGRATLGRVLFYDTKLSADNKISCASCHDQKLAFSDNVALSDGVNGRVTTRNSYPISSTASTRQYYSTGNNTLFWDARARRVVEQSRQTIENPNEMGMKMSDLVQKLKKEEYYKILFEKAFPRDSRITEDNILAALEEFVLSIILTDTKFDREYTKLLGTESRNFSPLAELAGFTESENHGKSLFMNNCASCHGETFTLSAELTANNGLDVSTANDQGAGQGKFKVPMIRNIALTGPYMHDGRFETLDDVIDFYSSGIQPHPYLADQLRNLPLNNDGTRGFNFTSDEKEDLKNFLMTLTDDSFADDVKFSSPFQ